MKSEVSEYFNILLAVCRATDIPLDRRYKQMRDLLERLCRMQMQDESLQMTDLAARINFVAAKVGLSAGEQNRLHTFRLTSNKILNRQEEPLQDNLLRDAKTLAFFVRKLYGEDMPKPLYHLLPQVDATYIVRPRSGTYTRRLRVCFQHADDHFLYVIPVDTVSEEPLRVKYNVPQVNDEFNDTCKLLWRFTQINLLDVTEDQEGVLTPSFIVLEPDYLLDISSLAECYKEYGHHPANYILNKLQPVENARPILLGNIANLFLDEWIHTTGEVDYMECMRKAFKRYPIELAACIDLRDPVMERQFFSDCRMHFEHIRDTVTRKFSKQGYKLDKTDAVLEPSYICEALGLQGRLDYMQRDMTSFIEMKSGKADEYSLHNKVEPKENNRVQMLLYQAVLQYSMGVDHHQSIPYLLYTRYPLLYPARTSWAMVRRVINLRNRIVADEYGIQLRNNTGYTRSKLLSVNSRVLNEKALDTHFWNAYLRPTIDNFHFKLRGLSEAEQAYFYSIYNFITKELYTSKSGDVEYEGRMGAASLWLSPLADKIEAGEIVCDLTIKENNAADERDPYLLLAVGESTTPEGESNLSFPNFRQGDAVVLYQRNATTDNVTNNMVFKANIEYITYKEIKIRLRAAQQNKAVLPAQSLYAIEHDSMDTTFRNMFYGLATFLSANQERRDLLLSARPPAYDPSYDKLIDEAPDDFTRVALKAEAAKDFFLLVGPPGTGKTSRALKQMVEHFHRDKECHILLLSYTNRAVDEICKALHSITPEIDFIRIGSSLSCDEAYRHHLIENVLEGFGRRTEVIDRISRCRVFVGTVATLCGKPELFRLKRFDVAIIDEATQILEPQLLGILCARAEDNTDAVGKFVLIGDHKQLPAVVLQSPRHTEVRDESLRAVGITNLRDSLFERLYRSLRHHPQFADQLCKQGRMHPEVANFPNHAFYGGKLVALGLPHQTETLSLSNCEVCPDGALSDPILGKRVAFIPSLQESAASSFKINLSEASIVATLATKIYNAYGKNFETEKTLGIIAPYRSQIALIRSEIAKEGIEGLDRVLIDTVERFQGSERDVIIYSLCFNQSFQLNQLCNVIEDDNQTIDRKLNVALTRARKQMFITGVPDLLRLNSIYSNLLNLMNK